MRFAVRDTNDQGDAPSNASYLLVPDPWDDWYKFDTKFTLWKIEPGPSASHIGSVKIGQAGLRGGPEPDPGTTRKPQLPPDFDQLGPNYFSLGQGAAYYESLVSDNTQTGPNVFGSLNDVANDPALFARHISEPVMYDSLLRYVDAATVEGQFRRLASGGERLAPYSFAYRGWVNPKSEGQAPVFRFDVTPKSLPPTNIHVMIGRNGVGKSHVLHSMVPAYLKSGSTNEEDGQFSFQTDPADQTIRAAKFAGMVAINFSAFDDLQPLDTYESSASDQRFSYIGLRIHTSAGSASGNKGPKNTYDQNQNALLKTSIQLGREFVKAAKTIAADEPATARWQAALDCLNSDPVFKTVMAYDKTLDFLSGGSELSAEDEAGDAELPQFWTRLSSGHKLVLLTVTRLVETVQEQTLVLIDEPENHLHPPLLASFIRALSELLTTQNGVAILATHSPVVLQEVPKSCVSLVRKNGMIFQVDRPRDETFGESLGVLTSEVFGLEVTRSGFNKILTEAALESSSYESALSLFEGQLGGEARAILRGLAARSQGELE